ncbi:hypothetical protein FPV67DRAFT_1614590 [Lyophyllum atratum]|nr:hypothetical protein FPV67DRAFT_1614590 [Lyophyllum atratum]
MPHTSHRPSPCMNLTELSSIINNNPEMASVLDYDGLVKYIHLIRLLKPTLSLFQSFRDSGPLETLPVNVHDFLKVCLGLEDEIAKSAWAALRHIAWQFVPDTIEDYSRRIGGEYLQLFLNHGLSRGIAFYNICPPTRVCLDPACLQSLRGSKDTLRERELVESLTYPVTVFTQDFGAIPGLTTSMYCRNCKTRYYANYYVHDSATTRTYYHGPFDFIHIAQHVFISARTCELFSTMMVMSWTSATNCARIYNEGLVLKTISASLPAVYSKSLIMDVEDVWNAVFHHWLLQDAAERNDLLELEHNAPSQAERLRPALRARNLRMVGPGQDEWNHACDLCCWVNKNPTGELTYLRSTVTDGITIGHPCCSQHDCSIPLASVKDHYCPAHGHREYECAVTTCTAMADDGYKTCSLREHRRLEDYTNQQNKAMFQLKHRLARLKVSQPDDSVADLPDIIDDKHKDTADVQGSTAHADEEVEVDVNGVCDGKSEKGNTSVRARFGRKRTHNEQLCVASCGVILGRATFYGSEAPNGVRTFWMRLFPTRASLPGVLWHDNNCRIRLMLNNDEDPLLRHYFNHCALPVDVFHFKCKHKETDIECGTFCNPYIWPELRTEDGKWRFNSSAAEQANAWFGGYQAIVREMQVDRYEFFLDEMIKRRNRIIIRELERTLRAPYSIPRHILLRPDA